jgi:hypothetical protein
VWVKPGWLLLGYSQIARLFVNAISRNKVVVPEGAVGVLSDHFYELGFHLR